uniref:Uncharacterized protein n=1 Tax=Strigamia maritima TaxID=126957 RepID=T1IHG4_STRMM
MISENGDDKKTQKSRSVPILSSPATGVREHVPSEVSINSNYACDMKHGLDGRLIGNKYQQLNSHAQDDLISGTDTSSSEIYGKSPCFVVPKKRRKSNRDNYWPTFEQNRPILEENAINESMNPKKSSMDSSSKGSIRVRSSGFFVPNWSAAGEECVDDLESSSDFRDENDYSQDEDQTQAKIEMVEQDGEKSETKSDSKVVETEDRKDERNDFDETGDDEMQTPTYEHNFEHFMTVCEDELLENEAFPKLWASDLSCTEDHVLLSSSHKTSECLEGSKASLCLDEIGLGFIDDVELQLATAADDVVQTIIKEETQVGMKSKAESVDSFTATDLNEQSKLPMVICSHMTVEQRKYLKSEVDVSLTKKQNSEMENVTPVTARSDDDFFNSKELYEQLKSDVQNEPLEKSFSHDNVLTPSEECIIEMYDRSQENGEIDWQKSPTLDETNMDEMAKSTEDLFESKKVLTISLEKLHLERKRNGSFCQVNNMYAEKPEAFENYMDSDDGGRSSQNNTSGMEETFSPRREDYYTTEKACQMTPRMTNGRKVQSLSEEHCKSSENEERYFLAYNSDTNNAQNESVDFDEQDENLNKMGGKSMCAFSSRGLHCNIPPVEKAPLLLCDDIKLFKQRRSIRPHSASTNRETMQENGIWTQQLNEFNKQRAKTTPKSFLIDKTCGDVRSDECLSSASVISPSGISENVDVESPSWSNESVSKYREFAKMRKRELLARFVAERKHREELDQLLAQLHDSYDKLLAKHAEAENTIDQLRLGKPMKIDNLRLSPGINYAQLEAQINSLEYPKSLPVFPVISPRIHNPMNIKENLMKKHNVIMDGFSSSNRVADSFCQTDFSPQTVNEPFCSSVASFLLRANCLLEQVNSLHECMVEGINIEANVAMQMLSYLWESYLSLQHDVQAHVGHTAALEKIALEDVRNLLAKIHSQLVAIETHQANVSWKGLLPFMEKKIDIKNFSFLRETSSYGSLPTSPTVSTNSQHSESRENFSLAEVDSGCMSSEKRELKPSIKRQLSKKTEVHHTSVDTSDYLNTNLDKVESKSSNESECIEVVKTLLRAIHSEEIQSSFKERSGDAKAKSMSNSLSETQSLKRARKEGQNQSELDAIFVLCDENKYGTIESDTPRQIEDETIDISCKTCRRLTSAKEKTEFQLTSGDLMENNEKMTTKSTPTMSDKFDTSDKVSSNDTEGKEVEHQETLNLLATLDAEQMRILEETLRLLSSGKMCSSRAESQANTTRSLISVKETEERMSPIAESTETTLNEPNMADVCHERILTGINEQLTMTSDVNAVKKDIFIRLLDEIKQRFNLHYHESASEACQSEDEWELKDEGNKKICEVDPKSDLVTVVTDLDCVKSGKEEFNVLEDKFCMEQSTPKSGNNDLSVSSEFSTESFSEVNSEVGGFGHNVTEDVKRDDEDKHTKYVYLRSDNEDNNDRVMFEKLNKQIQQLRYELLERGLHGDDIYNKSRTQASQTEVEKLAKDESLKHHTTATAPITAADDLSVKIRNGDTILHCCGQHHLVRQKNQQESRSFKNFDGEDEKLACCPYCHQLISRGAEPKPVTLTSSISSDMIAESEDQRSSIPVTTPGLNNEDDCSVQKCSSFTESESTNMDTTTLITAVCNCMEEKNSQGNKMSSQVREVFFAMLECDGYGTKECYAAVETSNTLKAVPTIESVSSRENVSQSPSNNGDVVQVLEKPMAEFWNKPEDDIWYGYPVPMPETIIDPTPKAQLELQVATMSPPGSEEQSWSSHCWMKHYQFQVNSNEYEAVEINMNSEQEVKEFDAVQAIVRASVQSQSPLSQRSPRSPRSLRSPQSPRSSRSSRSPRSPRITQLRCDVPETDIRISDDPGSSNDQFEIVLLSPRSDLSRTTTPDCPASDASNEQTIETTETSLATSSTFTEVKRDPEEANQSSSSYNKANKETMAEVIKVNEESQSIDIDDESSDQSISADKINNEDVSLNEECLLVVEEKTECEVSEIEERKADEEVENESNETQVVDLYQWTSVGIQVEPSQHDVNVQVWPSLKDRDTQMTTSADSSQDTDADAMSINSKDQTDQEHCDKCSTAVDKLSVQSLTLTRKNDDSTETDELVVNKKGNYQLPMSDSELPKSRKHSRKVSKRSGSHSCSLQSSQNDNHQSCKSCARLLRKTEALATTMLKELKGHPLTSESSEENVEMKKLQLIHALDLANKIAKRLKHHSVQMLQSLNPGVSVTNGSSP